jgi:hypothetical protein
MMEVIETKHEKPTFLILPQELRDNILDIVLRTESVVVVSGSASEKKRGHDVKSSYRGLASSCRQLYWEATQIFYKNNTFDFWARFGTPEISDRCSRFIRSINIKLGLFFKEHWLDVTIAEICIRGLAVTVKATRICWSDLTTGLEETTTHAIFNKHAGVTAERIKSSLTVLYDALQTGDGIGIDTLWMVNRKLKSESI